MKSYSKVHIEMVREKTVDCDMQPLSSPALAAEFGRSLYYKENEKTIRSPSREIFTVCSINSIGEVLAVECTFIGTTSKAEVEMKEIFMSPILSNAAAIICYHNHPSGDPNPSVADNLLTKRLEQTCALMDIPLHDHIILGEKGYYSYEEKKMSEWRNGSYEKAG